MKTLWKIPGVKLILNDGTWPYALIVDDDEHEIECLIDRKELVDLRDAISRYLLSDY